MGNRPRYLSVHGPAHSGRWRSASYDRTERCQESCVNAGGFALDGIVPEFCSGCGSRQNPVSFQIQLAEIVARFPVVYNIQKIYIFWAEG